MLVHAVCRHLIQPGNEAVQRRMNEAMERMNQVMATDRTMMKRAAV
jgi:hypothetical protein